MDIEENLAGKTVLEVGSGRGDTTRKLVDLLDGQSGASLIVTDISERFFQQLREEFKNRRVAIRFEKTEATQLANIENESVSYVVCNYALCAVNSKPGTVTLALRRFWEVLQAGGKLLVEEEFPIYKQDSPKQRIWAEKWRVLKSALMLSGKFPYNEIAPETLAELCHLIGYEEVEWSAYAENYPDRNALDFFQRRMELLLPELPNDGLRDGFSEIAEELVWKANKVGGMEIPYYRLSGEKAAG